MSVTFERIRAALTHRDETPKDHRYIDTSRAKPAGVVLPVTLAPEPSALFILRGAHLNEHAGEVGFPGGKPEPLDIDLRATALRELGEEIGLFAGDVEWLGLLSPCPVITGRYLIHPFVAGVREGASPMAVSSEIESILTLPLLPLITGEMPFYGVTVEWMGKQLIAQHFRIGPSVLYGASATIFYELLVLVAAELGLPMAKAIPEETPPWGDRYGPPRRRV
jgi:8-oxo-dGTP pyrophosphatase MutT (NUDIX family)